jgi:hypothetical protein
MQCDNDCKLPIHLKVNFLVFNITINNFLGIEEMPFNTAPLLLLTFVIDLMIHIRAYPPNASYFDLAWLCHSAIEPRRLGRGNVRR